MITHSMDRYGSGPGPTPAMSFSESLAGRTAALDQGSWPPELGGCWVRHRWNEGGAIHTCHPEHRHTGIGLGPQPGPMCRGFVVALKGSEAWAGVNAKLEVCSNKCLLIFEQSGPATLRRSCCALSTAAVESGWRGESRLSDRQHDSVVVSVVDRRQLRRPD